MIVKNEGLSPTGILVYFPPLLHMNRVRIEH